MLCRVVFFLGLTVMAYAGLPPGRPLPEVPISGAGGRKLDLKTYRGKALVVALVAISCKHCATVLDVLKKLQVEQGARGLRIVAAAGDENARESPVMVSAPAAKPRKGTKPDPEARRQSLQ